MREIFLLFLALPSLQGGPIDSSKRHYLFKLINTKPAISRTEYNTMMEKMLAYLNKMHDRHPNVTEPLAVEIGKTAANFSNTEEERRAALDSLILKLNGTTMHEAEMKAERLVNYFNNYKSVFERLKLDGAQVWGVLSTLPFKTDWEEMNYPERRLEILNVIKAVALEDQNSYAQFAPLILYYTKETKIAQVGDKEALVSKLLVPLNRAITVTDSSNKTQAEYFRRVWRSAADVEQESTARQEKLIKMFVKDYGKSQEEATKFAQAFTNLADSLKELMEKMGMYAVEVFQKAYELVFNENFRNSNDEKKKEQIWEAIKSKQSIDMIANSTGVLEEDGKMFRETSIVRVRDGIVYENSTIRSPVDNNSSLSL